MLCANEKHLGSHTYLSETNALKAIGNDNDCFDEIRVVHMREVK